MPTYEYQCHSCGHRFERFQSITASTALACPRCRKRARRVICAGGGFLFKGSGFYITDYRSAGYKKQAREEAQSKPRPEQGVSPKSDGAGVEGSAPPRGSVSHAKEKKG